MAQASDRRSADQIRKDLHAARARMSANVEGLVREVHPKAVKQRAVDDVKSFARTELDNAKSTVIDDDGLRTDRLAIVAGVLVGTVIALVAVRRMVSKVRRRS